ncbi:MAG: DUF2339 domain-containing protein, partial [Oscillospiraceae bacterium]|nr:DUF2339 domain-containing protein [Oscillospiraceae bacterium]
SAVIVGGNILCCKKTYRFGVFLSLVLTLVAGVFMWVRFWPASVWQLPFANTGLSSAAIAAAFIAQFVCASFLSYLLSVSTNRLQEETVQGVVHLGNKLLWIAAFVLNGYLLVYRLAYAAAAKTVIFVALPAGQPFYAAIAVATAAGLAVLLLHAALTLWMGRKLQFHRPLETLSVLLLSAVAGVLLFVLWVAQFQMAVTVPRLIWLLPLGALLLLAQRVSHNKAYGIAANVFFGIDLIFMLAHGYAQLTGYGTVALSVGYMCLYLILIAGQWLRGGAEHRKQYSVPARVAAYLVAEVSLVMILLRSSLPHKGVILLLTMTALNLLLLLFRYDGRKNGCRTGLYWLLRANEWLWIAADAVCIVFIAKGGALTALYAVLAVLAAALALLRVKENLWKGINAREEALYIVKINALAAGVTLGFSMDSPYRGALLLLVMTALCIVFYALRVWLYRRHGLDSARAPVDIALRIYEGLWLLAGILCIALVEKGGAFTALYTVLAIFTAALALLRIKRNLWDNIRAGEEALYLVKISALAAGFVLGFTMDSPYRGALLLLAMTALCIVFYALRGWLYRRHELDSAGAPVDVVLRIYEGLWFIADVACIAFVTKFDYTANALYLVLAALALGLIAVRARGLFTGALHAGWQVWLGIQLTALIMATVFGHTYWFDNTYVVSLMCMLTALAAIVVGFLARAQYLRLYGLVLTLLCVLKLVTYDVAGLDTVLRVVTLISGGVICFAISALYSYSVKKINAARGTQEEKDRETETKTE